jgi:hypothetical protein
MGDLNYQGTWNASTNTPTLTSSVGTKGYYYVVDVSGNTNLNGITDWVIGDWAIFNGSIWQKVDNTDAVTSVNGYTGTVVLNAADVGAVPYTGATGAVDLNAKSLTNVSNLGINTTSVPTIKLRAIGDNNSTSRIAMRGYSSDANSSAIRVTKFRGTFAAPQAPQSGDSLGKFELAGYGTTSSDGYPQASYEGLATEAWGATARGTKVVFKVTPNTTTTQSIALTLDQNSAATFASSVTATSFSGSGASLTNVVNSLTASTGISVSGSTGAVTVTNTAPDQTVAIASGTGISVSGTYPNFTVTNTAPSSGGTVTSVTATAPVASTGGNTPVISMPVATGSANGYLSSTDWTTFNNKSNTNGTVTSVSATVPSFLSVTGSPITTSGTLALTYSGTALPIANGGTGETTRQNAMDALAGAVTSGQYLRGNGTDVVMSAIQAADVPTLNQNTTGNATTATTATNATNSAITNDDTTNATMYPVWVTANTGNLPLKTSSGDITFNPSTGLLNSKAIGASNGIVINNMTISASYSIPSGYGASSVGPVTVASGQSVTVPSGSRWVVL